MMNMNNIIKFPKKKKTRKYIKKKCKAIAIVYKAKPIIAYGFKSKKELLKDIKETFKSFIDVHSAKYSFHLVNIPWKNKYSWKYLNASKYVNKQIKKLRK